MPQHKNVCQHVVAICCVAGDQSKVPGNDQEEEASSTIERSKVCV